MLAIAGFCAASGSAEPRSKVPPPTKMLWPGRYQRSDPAHERVRRIFRTYYRKDIKTVSRGRRVLGTLTIGSQTFTLLGFGCRAKIDRDAFAGKYSFAYIRTTGNGLVEVDMDHPNWGPHPGIGLTLSDGRQFIGEYTMKDQTASGVLYESPVSVNWTSASAPRYWMISARSRCLTR